jgi:putative tryptophan/tyrosine transport system substrate-binding protein
MRRREFIAGLGSATVWPVAGSAQQPRVPVIGYLASTSQASDASRVTLFRQGLSDTGFVGGRNLAIDFRYADNHLDRLSALAADLVRWKVAVIVTDNPTTPVAMAATSIIPIVFMSGGDPAVAGFVTRLNRPGGNVTGVSLITDTLNPRRLELLHELVIQ